MVENPQTFEDYFRNYHFRLVQRAYRSIKYRTNWQQAEEIVQDMWLAASQAWDKCEEEQKRGSWLIGILNNKILHYLRNRERKGRPTELHVATIDYLDNLSVDETTPEDVWLAVERLDEMDAKMKALDNHNAGWYAVVYMHRILNLTLKEIAERLDIPSGTAYSRLSRGLAFLGVDTQYGKRDKQELSNSPVYAGRSIKDGHPWYAPHGSPVGPEYRPREPARRSNHNHIGGAASKPNCPGYRKCPVCQHFHDKDRL